MNTNAVSAAIVARLQADQGGGALFATGGGAGLITAVYRDMAPPNATMPYVVFDCKDEATDNSTFTSDILRVRVAFAIFIPTTTPPSVIDTIKGRIFGDATDQEDGVPTFGFHRHTLSLSAGRWVTSAMLYENGENDSDLIRYVDVSYYGMNMSRECPTGS